MAKHAPTTAPAPPPDGEARAADPPAPEPAPAPVWRAVGCIQHGARGVVTLLEPGDVIPEKLLAELRANGLTDPQHFTKSE